MTSNNLQIVEVPVLSTIVLDEAEKIVKTHKIDFLDAFQIVTIIQGKFRVFGSESTILITADSGLAKAARAKNVRVWDCTSEPAPDHLEELT